MSGNHRLFCSKPFTWFEVSRWERESEVFVCCPAWVTTSIGNLVDSSVQEIWNGDKAKEFRRSILDGSFEYCIESRCPFLQGRSGPVQLADEVTDPMLRRVIDEGLTEVPWGPLDINASHDRSCNLSCPSCRTHVIMEHNRRDEILAVQEKFDRDALPGARYLYISGSGDPFGSPYSREWLRSLKPETMPNLKDIRLHTNAQLWTKRTWELIPPGIRELIHEADISIDAATTQTYEINRRGGDFDRLLDNLTFIATELRPRPIEYLTVSMVVQQNNFREMESFVELGKRFGVDSVYFGQLVNWGTFTEAEFSERAIHLPTHPEHQVFLESLARPVFKDPTVVLGNLSHCLRPSSVDPVN